MKRLRIPLDLWWKIVSAAGESKMEPIDYLIAVIERGLKIKK